LNLTAGGFTGFNVEGFLPGERVAFQRAYTTLVLFHINRYFDYYVGGCVKILIVDDSKQIRFMLQRLLERWGYEVIAACNGMEAWQYIQHESINLIISDWVMPQMDGLELCRRLRADDFAHYVYIILLTSKDNKADLIEGMEAGADDFLIKPFHADELRLRIRAGERILRLESTLEERNQKLHEMYQHLEQAYSQIRKDLEAAATMQQSLLPETAVTLCDVRFDWIFRPCAFVAGDIFNFFRLDEHHLGFYHLDVAGHGIPSALLSVTLSKVLNPDPNQGSPLKYFIPIPPHYEINNPIDVVRQLNNRFQSDSSCAIYFTMVYGVLDTRSRFLMLTQAGHPSPIHLGCQSAPALLGTGGFPVGMLPEVDYESVELNLNHGDRLFLYSDGVTECMNESKEVFGDERLQGLLKMANNLPLHDALSTLENALSTWRGDTGFDDDISILALEIT
jgi:phosphoserine phosphatase RsbU/P